MSTVYPTHPAANPALSLAPVRETTDPIGGLAHRIRMVLETPPGRLPWRPDFGVDLDGVAGGPATTTRLDEARLRILAALERWLPDVTVRSCEVGLAALERMDPSDRTIPTAERALAGQAVGATLELRLVLETDVGPVSFEATLTP